MKLRLLLLCFLCGVLTASAQYTVRDGNGNVINDGDIIEFGTIDYPAAELPFFVTNDASETIYSRVKYLGQTNASNPDFYQLCYGEECYWEIVIDGYVPPVSTYGVTIESGETTQMGNHFYNNDTGNGVDNVDFTFAFLQLDGPNSFGEIGDRLTFTYRYNPLLSVNDVNPVNLSLHATVVSDRLVMDVNEPVSAIIYDIQGRLINQVRLDVGQQEINVSNLSSQTYIIQFKNDHGAVKTSKFVVR